MPIPATPKQRLYVSPGTPTDYGGPTVRITGYRPIIREVASAVPDDFPGDTAPFDEWVLAHWPHMVNTGGSLSRFKGWFPSKRTFQGWRAKFGSYQANHIAATPSRWKPLEPDALASRATAQQEGRG